MSDRSFNSQHIKQLKKIIVNAFSISDLKQLVRYELNRNLDDIVAEGRQTTSNIAEELIRTYIEKDDDISGLLKILIRERPRKTELIVLRDSLLRNGFSHKPIILYSPKDTDRIRKAKVNELIATLYEWSLVLWATQELFFRIDGFEQYLSGIENNITDCHANELENIWIKNCEAHATKIRTVLKNSYCKNHISSVDLNAILSGEKYVAVCIRELTRSNIKELKNSLEKLKSFLEESQKVSAVFVKDITADLHRRSSQLEI